MKIDTASAAADMLINPEYKIKDADMKTGDLYTHGTQIYKLEFYNGEKVTLWNEEMKHRHEEKRKFFQKYYRKKIA